jgi:hypothetical protein
MFPASTAVYDARRDANARLSASKAAGSRA